MLKGIAAIFLLLALMVQTFSKTAIFFNFFANQSYITKVLCENKDKPQLYCCGKCQLRKSLRQEENSEKQNEERKQKINMDIALLSSFFPYQSTIVSSIVLYPAKFAAYAVQHPDSIFHPPCD